VRHLISFQSLNGQEMPIQEYLALWMRENDMQVNMWDIDLDELKQRPAYSAEAGRRRLRRLGFGH